MLLRAEGREYPVGIAPLVSLSSTCLPTVPRNSIVPSIASRSFSGRKSTLSTWKLKYRFLHACGKSALPSTRYVARPHRKAVPHPFRLSTRISPLVCSRLLWQEWSFHGKADVGSSLLLVRMEAVRLTMPLIVTLHLIINHTLIVTQLFRFYIYYRICKPSGCPRCSTPCS